MACPAFRDVVNKKSRELEEERKAKRRPTRRNTMRGSLDLDEVFTN